MKSKTPTPAHVYTADYFENRCGGIEFFKAYRQKVLKPLIQAAVLEADLKMHHTVLDVGCGRGELVAHLADKGMDVIGVDYAEDAVKLAKETFPQARFQVASADGLSFPEQSFDRIFFLGIIEHLTQPEIDKSLSQMAAMLKPGGKLLITTCTNQLYFKVLTYRWRRSLIQFLNRFGLRLKQPRPLKSEEDDVMHIHELHYFSLRRALSSLGWNMRLLPRPNPKLATLELYGKNLPSDFPVRFAAHWKQYLYRPLFFWFPLNLLLARAYLTVLEKPDS